MTETMGNIETDLKIIFTKGAGGERYNALIRMAVQETLPGGMIERAKLYAALAQAEATFLTR